MKYCLILLLALITLNVNAQTPTSPLPSLSGSGGITVSDTTANRVVTQTFANANYKEIYTGATLPASATLFQTGNKFLLTTDSTEYTYQGNHVWFSNIVKGTATPLQKVVSGTETFDNSRAVWKNPLSSITVDFVYRGSTWQPQKGYLDVIDFGANTAYTDNSTYFNAALYYATTNSLYTEVRVPEGFWNFTKPIIIKSYNKLIGVNKAKSILNANTGFIGQSIIELDSSKFFGGINPYFNQGKIANLQFTESFTGNTAISDSLGMNIVNSEFSDLNFYTTNAINLIGHQDFATNPNKAPSGYTSSYVQFCTFKNFYSQYPINKFLFFSGNLNFISNIDIENPNYNTTNELIRVDATSNLQPSSGNTFTDVLIEGAIPANRTVLNFQSAATTQFKNLWLEIGTTKDSLIIFKKCGDAYLSFSRTNSLNPNNNNKIIVDSSTLTVENLDLNVALYAFDPILKTFGINGYMSKVIINNFIARKFTPQAYNQIEVKNSTLSDASTWSAHLAPQLFAATTNLVQNGGFEKGINNWTTDQPTQSIITDTVGYAGIGRCVKIAPKASGINFYQQVAIPADLLGKPITFSYKLKTTPGLVALPNIDNFSTLNADNTYQNFNDTSNSKTWQSFSYTTFAKSNPLGVYQIDFNIFGAIDTLNNFVYIDDVVLSPGNKSLDLPKNDEILYNNGNITAYSATIPTWLGRSGDYIANSAITNSISPLGWSYYNSAWNPNYTNTSYSVSGNIGINNTTPLYKLDVLSSANPLRLQGLQTGASTDDILSSLGGVVRKLSISQITGNSWSLLGNAGTTAGTNFLGTTDNVPLQLITNNTVRTTIDGYGNFTLNGTAPAISTNSSYAGMWFGGTNTGFLRQTSAGYRGLLFASNVAVNGGAYANIDATRHTYLMDLGYEANNDGFQILSSPATGGAVTFNTLLTLTDVNTYFKNNIGINNTAPAYKLDIDAKTASTGNPIRLQGLNIGAATDSIVTDSAGILRRLSAAQVVQNGITKTSVTSTFTVPASGEYLIPFTLTGTTNTSIVAASYIATDVTGCSFSIPYLAGDGTGTVKVINRTASAVTFTGLKVNFAVLSY